MEKLLNKYKEIKKTRKGFTLVELLVVIAILAVLASVSVVGYLGFTSKAKNSAALTELSQAREAMRIQLVTNTSVTKNDAANGNVTFTYSTDTSNNNKKIEYTYSAGTTTTVTWDTILKTTFTDLAELNGTFEVAATSGSISTINYLGKDGGSASWTISTDALSQGVYQTTESNKNIGVYSTAQ